MAKRLPSSVSVSNTTRAFLSPGSSTKIECPPMPCSGLHDDLAVLAANAAISSMSRVTSVGAQHCGNQAV